MSNETNAYKGHNIEVLFKNSIDQHKHIISTIKKALSIDDSADFAKAYITGKDKGKADVLIRFDNGRTLGANIKSYTVGFNQAVRMPPHRFIKAFGITDKIAKILIDSILRKAKGGKSEPFIASGDAKIIAGYFRNIAYDIITRSICGTELPELFVLWNDNNGKMSIYLMPSVLLVMKDCIDVSVSRRGVISLNPYFTIQKKGGNGKHSIYTKTDIRHGGNNIQVKIKTAKLGEKIKPLCYYCI